MTRVSAHRSHSNRTHSFDEAKIGLVLLEQTLENALAAFQTMNSAPDAAQLLEHVREAKVRVQEHPEEFQLMRERQKFFTLVAGLVRTAFSLELVPNLSNASFPSRKVPTNIKDG